MINGEKGLQSNDLKINLQNWFYFGKNANVLFVLYINLSINQFFDLKE